MVRMDVQPVAASVPQLDQEVNYLIPSREIPVRYVGEPGEGGLNSKRGDQAGIMAWPPRLS
jgi:hypothetical protein